MKYLLSFAGAVPSPFATLPADQLAAAQAKLVTALKDGSLDCAYSKLGGGGFMVVNSSSHEALTKIIRGYHLTDIEVTPLIETADLLGGYEEARKKLDAGQKP